MHGQPGFPRLHARIGTALRHRWLDAGDARRALPAAAVERLRQRVAASEQRHTGEIRICVESGLPRSYLWRHVRQHEAMAALVHQRALMMFSRLRVWDTEDNNGVLVYLLLAERRIELIADRGLAAVLPATAWQGMVHHLGDSLCQGRFEDGLTQALDEVSAALVEHFPRRGRQAGDGTNRLPDTPVIR